MQQDKFPQIDQTTRMQQLTGFFNKSRPVRIARFLGGPARRQYKIHPKRTAGLLMVLLALVSGAVYASTLQNFPASPTTNTSFVANCPTLSYPASMPSGASGSAQVVSVNCGGPTAAFTTQTISNTPTFTLPTTPVAVTSLSIVASTGSCGTGEIPLTTGSPVSLTAGSFNYCVHYTNPASPQSISSFSISWAT